MIFTSATFAIFLTVVFLLYWLVFSRNLIVQNLFLLISSYIFYGWLDWRFLLLLFSISGFNYLIAIVIQKNDKKTRGKILFITGLFINILTLFIFKYLNFFINEIGHVLSQFGTNANFQTLNIILPIGISFYIFLSISYLIDVHQHKIIAVRNFPDVLLAFSFFPIILAGPIQRPISLLPQIQSKRIFRYEHATDGLKQILWGVFMKIVIADNCAETVNVIFKDFSIHTGSTLILGIFLFTIQIYADFAGYSNIAIGVGKLLGFNIMQNFAYPYFARDIREFWKRWNISLTTWFRDYVFLPIAYSVSRKIKSERFLKIKTEFFIYAIGLSVTWMLNGLWHGANYTFIIWGLIQGFFLIMNHITSKPIRRFLKRMHIGADNIFLTIFDTLLTFIIIMFSWIFFRADNVNQAFGIISEIFSRSSIGIPQIIPTSALFFSALFFIFEWLGRHQEYAVSGLGLKWPRLVRWTFYSTIILTIIWFSGVEQQFIYFKF